MASGSSGSRSLHLFEGNYCFFGSFGVGIKEGESLPFLDPFGVRTKMKPRGQPPLLGDVFIGTCLFFVLLFFLRQELEEREGEGRGAPSGAS